MAISKECWIEIFRDELVDRTSTFDIAVCILGHIDGYGVEYGFNQGNDASDLLTAFEAMQEYKWKEPIRGE